MSDHPLTAAEYQVLQQRIKMLHALFNLLSGESAPLTMTAIGEWEMWVAQLEKAGHDPEQALRFVYADMDRYNQGQKDPRYLRKMTFNNTIHQRDTFAARLAQAQSRERETAARKRAPVRGEREELLEATGRPARAEQREKSAGQVMRDSKAFRDFQEWHREFEKSLTEDEKHQ